MERKNEAKQNFPNFSQNIGAKFPKKMSQIQRSLFEILPLKFSYLNFLQSTVR